MEIPPAAWQALAALMTAVATLLGLRARRESRRHEEMLSQEPSFNGLRKFVDERADHKVRQALNVEIPPIHQRLDRVEADVRGHLDQTQQDVREFYTLTGELKTAVKTLESTVEKVREDTGRLLLMVGELRGRE